MTKSIFGRCLTLMSETRYWRISPGQGDYLWRQQKLKDCIALGGSETGSVKGKSRALVEQQIKRTALAGAPREAGANDCSLIDK
ncbi:hypothetical protein SBV1_410133 [Verrucomicrobia bacterium]|nr:hypothetical protein SBV1_410133 [Verrucomicrobiota bacterium]